MPWELHEQLNKDCVAIGDLPLCRLLLMDNRLFPWVILVPRVENASELADLSVSQRAVLMEEIALVSDTLKRLTKAYKMNIAALGNQVPQLHVHVIARLKGDVAWPQLVWGKAHEPYEKAAQLAFSNAIAQALGLKQG